MVSFYVSVVQYCVRCLCFVPANNQLYCSTVETYSEFELGFFFVHLGFALNPIRFVYVYYSIFQYFSPR